MEIDFTPLLELAAAILVPVLGVIGAWAATRLGKRFGIEIEEKHRQKINDLANVAVNFGMNKIKGEDGKVTTKSSSAVVTAGANYLIEAAPDALKYFKIDPSTPEGRRKIEEMIQARLGYLPSDGGTASGGIVGAVR